ncbi:MAG: Tyrosine--tRNA ligase [Chlamydiales bacterium]|nr:Tyrosine--tRNA ligase [Chlamydiales bacterium]MCH9620350.1 Tyrosine--tRNA ligase [Chlamydiales bacterium]MCH9622336.1 Tyrosine--tRNA ligase [Chlamydiales bacterium]
MNNVLTVLEERGFIDAMTGDELHDAFDKPLTCYVGFDPTADSLHIGNLVAIMGLAWLKRYGHKTIALVGGATGMVGDPSGKSVERNLLDHTTIEHNLKGIRGSLEAVLKDNVTILNNYDWFKEFGLIEFLRDVGKHFRMGVMLSKESVKARLNSEEGLSLTEFSYQLLQGYDFLHLHDHHGVTLQMGGSDQWGNIVAGCELVRKVRGVSVHGLTFPLMTRSDGKKFGKSEEGTIWLNPDRLSPYDFYQYFYRLPDADLPKLLRMLTFLELEEIAEIESKIGEPNYGQKRLAEEVTRIVHGEEGLKSAREITKAAKPGMETELSGEVLTVLSKELPSKTFALDGVIGKKLIDLYLETNLLTSRGEARRLIKNGGAYVNNKKVTDEHFVIEKNHLIDQKFLLLQVGKKKKMVISIE